MQKKPNKSKAKEQHNPTTSYAHQLLKTNQQGNSSAKKGSLKEQRLPIAASSTQSQAAKQK